MKEDAKYIALETVKGLPFNDVCELIIAANVVYDWILNKIDKEAKDSMEKLSLNKNS